MHQHSCLPGIFLLFHFHAVGMCVCTYMCVGTHMHGTCVLMYAHVCEGLKVCWESSLFSFPHCSLRQNL